MPVIRCSVNGEPGWKWGEGGKCYTGPDGRQQAEAQGRAVRVSGYNEQEKLQARQPDGRWWE